MLNQRSLGIIPNSYWLIDLKPLAHKKTISGKNSNNLFDREDVWPISSSDPHGWMSCEWGPGGL